MASAAADLKLGFWLGLGISLALMVWSLFQVFVLKAVHRDG
jgi:threonine/homoserine/homoserine lactone efflux protein